MRSSSRTLAAAAVAVTVVAGACSDGALLDDVGDVSQRVVHGDTTSSTAPLLTDDAGDPLARVTRSSTLAWFNAEYSVPCGESRDAFWTRRGSVFLMRKRGVLQELMRDPLAWIDDVRWDGELIWVAVRGKGLLIFDEDGNKQQTIVAADGLPPSDVRLLLHPLNAGQVIAVGSFGKQARGWIARIDVGSEAGDAAVRVIHEATRVPLRDSRQESAQDADVVFQPYLLHQCAATSADRSR